MPPALLLGIDSGILKTPSAYIVDSMYTSVEAHFGKATSIETFAVFLNVTQENNKPLDSTTMPLINYTRSTSCRFVEFQNLIRCCATETKEKEKKEKEVGKEGF